MPPVTTHQSALFTPAEAAEYLRVKTRTIERWRTSGDGPQFAKIGGRVAYRINDLDSWVATRVRRHTNEEAAR